MKLLFYPLALIYGWATSFRNHLYDLGIWKSVQFDVNVISVGNLAVGGTGKSPMVEFLVNLLAAKGHKPATLSRGYKRKTRGFRLASEQDSAISLGDEPYQFWLKFKKEIPVAVGEERVMAIPEILFQHEDRDVVICDDAFQHRNLRPNLSIVLSTYENPFYEDYLLPFGRLREKRNGVQRADILIFTKCPTDVDVKKQDFIKEARKYLNSDTPIFFTRVKYKEPVVIFDDSCEFKEKVLLVSGLADSSHLVDHVRNEYELLDHLEFSDHHTYSLKDAASIKAAIDKLIKKYDNSISILTTEKDFVKIRSIDELSNLPLFYLPIEIEFLHERDKFERLILESFND